MNKIAWYWIALSTICIGIYFLGYPMLAILITILYIPIFFHDILLELNKQEGKNGI